MTESQIWSDYFAVREADQLRRFPISAPLTPLQQAQYELAVDYFRRSHSLDKLREYQARPVSLRSDKPVLFRADAATRKAFFEHFNGDRVINIFCWRREEWNSHPQPFLKPPKIWPYSIAHHEFISGLEIGAEHMEQWHRFTETEGWPLDSVFVRSIGKVYGPLAGSGSHSIWHWNGEELIYLDEYGIMMWDS